MTATKKLYSDYEAVESNELTDEVPILQTINKVTTLQKIYNLFKTSFDSVYTTASAVASQISNALIDYATQSFVNSGLSTKQNKQSIEIVEVDASGLAEIETSNCILSIINIPGGAGNKTISIDCTGVLEPTDTIIPQVIYRGFDVNLRSYVIRSLGGSISLELFINVHSSPTGPVLISINKTN